jgi:hypothetical protein
MRTKPITVEASLTGFGYEYEYLVMRFQEKESTHEIRGSTPPHNTLIDTILEAFEEGQKVRFKGTYHIRTHPIIYCFGVLVSLPRSLPFDCREHFYEGTISTEKASYKIFNEYGLHRLLLKIST